MYADIGGVDGDGLGVALVGLEADVVEHSLHHRLQPPGADILDARIDLDGDVGDRVDRVLGEVKVTPSVAISANIA